MMQSGVPICISCGEQVGLNHNGEVFVACQECNYPICKSCFDYEIKDGRSSCLRCGVPYDEISIIADVETKESGSRSTMAAHLNTVQEVGLHARNISTVSTVDSEVIDESGNPIWKNRVESWKEKKNKKKNGATKVVKESQIPQEQQMEEKQQSAEASQPLSRIVPIPRSQLASYRTDNYAIDHSGPFLPLQSNKSR